MKLIPNFSIPCQGCAETITVPRDSVKAGAVLTCAKCGAQHTVKGDEASAANASLDRLGDALDSLKRLGK